MKPGTCPCGKAAYEACCGRHHGGIAAPDAESLMRSRYSAYVLELGPYLLSTWHPDTRPASIGFAKGAKWLGLEIRRFEDAKDSAIVEFVARCTIGGKAECMHEISRFTLIDGNWLYVDGEFPTRPAC